MLTFKPNEHEGLVESSDDLEGLPGAAEESSESEDVSEDNEEEDGHGGERSSEFRENPFYEDSDEDSDSDMSDH